MCHKFIFQSPALSLLGLRVAGPESQCSRSKVSCPRDLYSMVSSLRVTGSRVLGYWVLKFLVMGPRVQGHNLGLCRKSIMLVNDKSFFRMSLKI